MKVSLLASMAAMLTVACGGSTDPGASAHIRFVPDAPTCGDPRPVNFFIDNVQVGRDSMWFGFDPDTTPFVTVGPFKYRSYRSFSVQAGTHGLRAMIVDTFPSNSVFTYSWPDTTVNVAAGAEVVRKLPFYCS
jgi:hypothetical protein